MGTQRTHLRPVAGDPASDLLVERLVRHLKATRIYASHHERVRHTGEELLESLNEALLTHEPLVIRVRPERATVVGAEVALEGEFRSWLAHACRRALLAGFDVYSGVDLELLGHFAFLLHQCSRERTSLVERWPSKEHRLVPIELVYDEDVTGRGDEPTSRDELLGRLGRDGRVVAALTRIRGRLAAEIGDEPAETLDLLREIVDGLRGDAGFRVSTAAENVCQVLDLMDREFGSLRARPRADSHLTRTALQVARKFFAPKVEPRANHDDTLPTGRPGDQRIADDLQKLLEELQRVELHEVALQDAAITAHHLTGVLLHLMTRGELEATPAHAAARLHRLLREGDSELREVVANFVNDAVEEGGDRASLVLQPVFEHGFGTVLRQMPGMSVDVVVAAWPSLLVPFLDALDARDEDDRREIMALVTEVGSERLGTGVDQLGRSGLLTRESMAKLLALDVEAVLPAVAALANQTEPWARDLVAEHLFRRPLPLAESAALRIVVPSERLTRPYLRGLCDVLLGTADTATLRQTCAGLLTRFVMQTAEDPLLLEKRVHAVKALGLLRSPSTEQFLRSLRGNPWALLQRRDHRRVRRAAAEALRGFGG